MDTMHTRTHKRQGHESSSQKNSTQKIPQSVLRDLRSGFGHVSLNERKERVRENRTSPSRAILG